jgi:ATP-dependent DNA helicase RecG
MYVKGVGPARAQMLEAKGLTTVEDLLAYAPFRYEDRRNVKTIAQLAVGEMATVLTEVQSQRAVKFRKSKLGMFEATFGDVSGVRLIGKWFHGSYLEDVLKTGLRVALFGKVEFDTYNGALSMMHPEFEILPGDEEDSGLHTGRIVPVYEAAGKVTTRILRMIVHRILESLGPLEDPLPREVLERLKLPDRWTAMQQIHFPSGGTDVRLLNAFRSPAQYRAIFEEFFWLECGLALKKNKARLQPGVAFQLTDRVREQIKAMLPFRPTGAQKRVLREIADDMTRPHPMYRLLQGDVGSGKTLVAAETAIIAIENGYQVAVLAPTEILATQHYLYFKKLFQKLGYTVGLLTGSNTAKVKAGWKKLLRAGLIRMIVGTHALLEDDVLFQNLGLAIVDEQHRFGVEQRMALVGKASTAPDVLVMTATPIPRTLALTIYGDLDVSVIDELPPGRKPIQTKHVTEDQVETAYSFMKQQIDAGRQAYVVYPVIEESETQAMKAAQKMHQHLSEVVFPGIDVALLHGKMAPDAKESVMERFKKGESKILVSTTVIEVGVDVPNATVMVVEQAERFGLAQLHQLRGRVGRGGEQSYCILVTGKLADASRERIRTLVESTDGFYIAEMDLKLRGPGEFFGTKQSGLPTLRIANIIRDKEVLEIARSEATSFIGPAGESSTADEGRRDEVKRVIGYIRDHWQRRYGLIQIG